MRNSIVKLRKAVRHSLAQTQPAAALDARSLPVYGLVAAALAIEIAVLALTDFYIAPGGFADNIVLTFAVLPVALYSRRRHFPRIAIFVESVFLPGLASLLAVIGTVFLAAVSGPFVDSALDAADRWLGFDFEALAAIYRRYPDFGSASRGAYSLFAIQAMVVPSLLAMFGPARRFWIYLNAWCFALVAVVLIFPFAPASGPHVLHGIQEDVFVNFKQLFPWETGPAIEALRSGRMRDVAQAARGFVSMPSFHAVGAILFAWAAWPYRWLRWPAVAANAALVGSAIIIGSHYLVDLIAGMALAVTALLLAGAVVKRLGAATTAQASSSTSQ